ncbi:MAG TPA: DoxX family protein [Opitutaceae bacterium]|nr:DoxX family protein [Opitutaceae bacterium]
MSVSSVFNSLDRGLAVVASWLQPLVLLVIRLYWGWEFFITGKGHLMNLDKTTDFFTDLHIPLPKLNAILAGSTECAGGALLLLGLGTRFITVPLAFTMVIAYVTADNEALHAIFSDPDKFTGATPFLFLYASVLVFAFGPGRLSLDALIFPKKAAP